MLNLTYEHSVLFIKIFFKMMI